MLHLPCSHLMTACNARGLSAESFAASLLYGLNAVRLTWSGRFQPYLDKSQWPQYDGPSYLPDLGLIVKTRGRRRTKRFKMDMDRAQGGETSRSSWMDDHFVEDPTRQRTNFSASASTPSPSNAHVGTSSSAASNSYGSTSGSSGRSRSRGRRAGRSGGRRGFLSYLRPPCT